MGRADPDGNIHPFVTCANGINDSKYCNPEVDRLLGEARALTDPAAHKARYDAAAVILEEDMPIVYLYHPRWLWALDSKLQGFAPHPDGMIRLQGVSLAE